MLLTQSQFDEITRIYDGNSLTKFADMYAQIYAWAQMPEVPENTAEPSLEAWFGAAAQTNLGQGGASDLIRTYTAAQLELRQGGPIQDIDIILQDASNAIARAVYQDISDNPRMIDGERFYDVPDLVRIGRQDAAATLDELSRFSSNPAIWSGNLLFLGLGEDDFWYETILEQPGETYDLAVSMAAAVQAGFDTIVSGNLLGLSDLFFSQGSAAAVDATTTTVAALGAAEDFFEDAYGSHGGNGMVRLISGGLYVGSDGGDVLETESLLRGSFIVHGGSGSDFIKGSLGRDLLDGGSGRDTVSFFETAPVAAIIHSHSSTSQFSALVQFNPDATNFGNVFNSENQSALFNTEVLELTLGDDRLVVMSSDADATGLATVDGLGEGDEFDNDIIDLRYSDQGANVDLDTGVLSVGVVSLEAFDFESVIGSAFNDTISGEEGENIIDGGSGEDFIFGGGGKDELRGGAEKDIISDDGDVDGDLLDGGSGDDELRIEGIGSAELRGGSGEDILYGNGRSDLYGGSGADEFHITAGGGRNIKDAEGHDKLFINGVEITEISNDVIFGIEFGGASGNRDYVAVQKGGQIISWQEGEPVEASIGIVFKVTGIADDFDGTTSSILYDIYIFEDVSLTPTQSHGTGIDPGRLFKLSEASSVIQDFRQGDFGLFLDGNIELSFPRVLHNSTQVRGLLNYEGLDLTTGEDLEFGAPRLMSEAELSQERAREAISENPLLGFQSASVQNGTGEALRGDDSDGTFTLTGTIQGIALAGGGNDTVNGNDAALILSGGTGSDILNGGTSADLIFGDLAPGETSNDTMAASDDTITSSAGDDTIFAGEGSDSVDAGSGNDVVFGGSGADALLGGGGNDTLHGDEGDDTLEGGEGNDTLLGHIGDDNLSGGTGDDSLVGGDGEDFVDGGEGSDTLLGGDGADKLSGGADDDVIYGGADNDNIDGGSGNDTLEGARGEDTISGGAGDDLLEGGRGGDTYFYARGDGNDTIREFNFSGDSSSVDRLVFTDMNLKDITAILNINDDLVFQLKSGPAVTIIDQFRFSTLERVEEFEFADGSILTSQQLNATSVLLGTEGDDSLEGENASEELLGLGGNDVLLGGGGLDTLFGGEGNDSIAGGSGEDEHFGEGGDDHIVGQGGNDFVSGGDGNDRLEGSEGDDKLYGDAGNDTISGEAGNDAHFGGAGNDLIYGSGGDDTFDGGEGYDTLDFTYSSNNVAISLAEETATFESGFIESVTGFEAVLAGSGDNLINGNALHNLLHGGSGNDTLYGGDGNDTLDGGSGNDYHYGGGGNDLIIGNSGLDDYDGGTGFDTLDFSYSGTDSTIDLSLETVVFSHGTVNQAIAFEAAIAGSGQNTLVGTGADNLLDGGAGNDTLIGGKGSDELIGGAGQDTFVFADDTASSDTVIDYSEADDILDITAWGATGYGDLTVTSVEQGTTGIFDVQVVFGGNALQLAKISAADLAQIGSDDFIFT
ncbi:hypothetical protein V8J82_22520 [Gymnodinialimonas sp. 2305UL16-5]|uniref:calcium-binding protein n=1 Tax=Gymnodinialimonas mytili TaxID=3126503 RepID=UPI003095FC89